MIPIQKRVYVDEAGVEDTLTRLFGWSLRGTPCPGERRGHAKERVSMIAAWCQRTDGQGDGQGAVLAPLTFCGSCDAVLFEWWFEHQLLPLLEPGQVVILDNATFHRKKKLQELLEKHNQNHNSHCSLLTLPAYSPDLNKIEPLWNTIKNRTRYNNTPNLSFRDKVDASFRSL